MCVVLQRLEVISGFQRLRYLDGLLITRNPQLVAIDGLYGVTEVNLRVDIVGNPLLCYSLDSLSDKPFWQVCTQDSSISHFISVCCSLSGSCEQP